MSLTVLVTTAQGRLLRFGKDEPDAAWVPFGITFESALPGGWKQGVFNLRRRIDEPLEFGLFDDVEFIDEAGQTVYEGRIQRMPRQHGDDFMVGVQCLGHAVQLTDDTSFSMIYRDMTATRWSGTSLSRRTGIRVGGFQPHSDGQVRADPTNGAPALVETITGPWSAGVQPVAEAAYDAGPGNRIGNLYYGWRILHGINPADPNWAWDVALGTDDTFVSNDNTGSLRAAGPGSGSLAATTARRWALVQLYYLTGAGVENVFELGWWPLAVHGDHGLTKVGVEPGAGFYIDDMLAHALTRAAPKLNFTTGPDGSIQRPPLVVSQAAYHDPGSVEPVVLDLNKYVLYEWGVGPRKTFFFRQTDPDRLCWEARLDRGIHLALEGDDSEHVYNGAIVKYALPDGTRRIAGPPGSGFDVESALLANTDPANPVTSHGYRRYAELEVQFPLLDTYAPSLGAAYLFQANLPARSGTIDLVWEVEHPRKGMRPVREVLAPDYIRLSDHPADVPRRIISTSYSEDGRQCSVTVGNDMNTVDAILEQLGVTTRVRLGG